MKSMRRENKIYLALLIFFFITFLGISILFFIKKNNTSVIIQGEPKEIVLENFSGDIEFSTDYIFLSNGYITNSETIDFEVDGKSYTAKPNELVIEFKNFSSDDFDNTILEPDDNLFGSLGGPDMFVHTGSSVNGPFFSDRIEIKCVERSSVSDFDENGKKNKNTSYTREISMKNVSAPDSLRIENDYPLYADSDTIIKYKDSVLSDCGSDIILSQDATFSLVDISMIQLYLYEEYDDYYLNGQINKLSGTLSNEDAALYCTSGASQNSFFCGNQNLYVEGKGINVVYEYNAPSSDIIVNGKPRIATLEGIDILEGFVQYLVTNFDSFFFAFIGALLALVIDKTLNKG